MHSWHRSRGSRDAVHGASGVHSSVEPGEGIAARPRWHLHSPAGLIFGVTERTEICDVSCLAGP